MHDKQQRQGEQEAASAIPTAEVYGNGNGNGCYGYGDLTGGD